MLVVPIRVQRLLSPCQVILTDSSIENMAQLIPDRDEVYSKAVKDAQKEYLALLALSGANATRVGGLRDKLQNESLFAMITTQKIRLSFCTL